MVLQLSEVQLKVYDRICEQIKKGSYSIKLPSSLPADKLILFLKLVLGDNPELIDYNNCRINIYFELLHNRLEIGRVFAAGDRLNAKIKFDTESERIISAIIKPNRNDIQKVLAIHDYLVATVAYDFDELNNSDINIRRHTAYGAIVEKKAVCEGIAYAFSHLAKMAGLECTVVNGYAGTEEHSWNMVKIGGECYHIDATWDIRQQTPESVKIYDYFCLRDSDLSDRKWDKTIYPTCNSLRFNYFTVTKSFAHDMDGLREIILRQYEKYGALYLKQDFMKGSMNEISNIIIRELSGIASKHHLSIGSFIYLYNEEQSVFTLYKN